MIKLIIADIKLLIRNKQQLFWSLMFPLIFTVIFGFFFGAGTTSTGTIALINQSSSPLANTIQKSMTDSKLFKIEQSTDIEASKTKLKKAQLAGVVVIPANFGDNSAGAPTSITVYEDAGNAQGNSVINGFLNQYLTGASFQAQNAKPLFNLDVQNTNAQTFGYFDFVLVGLIGMALMNSSIQGVSIAISKYREDQILKRITTTPLPTWKFIAAEVFSRLVINVVQVGMILALGVYAFSAHINGSVPILFAMSLLGAILFQLIGFAIASVTKTTSAAEGMATAIAIPMMFLAGVFFPIDQLPKWLFSIVQYLPLAPLLRIIRGVALESTSPFDNPINMVLVLGWIAALLLYTTTRFRLTEE